MKFCPRCYEVMAQKWAKKAGYDPRYKLHVSKMSFPCQIPLYEPDSASGNPMVRIWNCKTKKFDIYGLKEYNDKKASGGFNE